MNNDFKTRASSLSNFDKLLILKTIRPEKVIFGISQFVDEYLGTEYISLPVTQLSSVYEDTDKTTPIIFVLSTGADPQSVLLKFSQSQGFENDGKDGR